LAFAELVRQAGSERLINDVKGRRSFGALLLALAAAAGTALAIYAFVASEGVSHTQGAAAVIGSDAVMLVAALLIAGIPGIPRFLRGIILLLLLIDIVATAIAAWFLELWVLVAFMAVALVGWLAHVAFGPGGGARVSGAQTGAAI
jgi:hypothetical protein